jgi:hypothetical protein
MSAMDTDRFVNDLNREREIGSLCHRHPLKRSETDCAVYWVRNYDTYIERQKLRTYSP